MIYNIDSGSLPGAAGPRVVRMEASRPDPAGIEEAAGLIRSGALVAFPTETVYGVGTSAFDREAVRSIFAVKGRPTYNPLIVHVADVERAREVVRDWTPEAEVLANAFWPGPLTLVLPKRSIIPDEVTAGLDTVAVRVPAHPVALAIMRAAGTPIAAPSANRFMRLSPTTAEHVIRELGDRIHMVVDAGPTQVGIESTVLDLSGPRPVLLRTGTIHLERLLATIEDIELPGAYTGEDARPSPGMLSRHYAPRARLVLVDPNTPDRLLSLAGESVKSGERVAIVLIGLETDVPEAQIVRLPRDAAAYARLLYATLHDLDDAGIDLILVEAVPEEPGWAGISDRLKRAASPAP